MENGEHIEGDEKDKDSTSNQAASILNLVNEIANKQPEDKRKKYFNIERVFIKIDQKQIPTSISEQLEGPRDHSRGDSVHLVLDTNEDEVCALIKFNRIQPPENSVSKVSHVNYKVIKESDDSYRLLKDENIVEYNNKVGQDTQNISGQLDTDISNGIRSEVAANHLEASEIIAFLGSVINKIDILESAPDEGGRFDITQPSDDRV